MVPQLSVNWRYFSLEQVNNEQGPNWKIWEQPEDYPSRGLRAFWAAEAARQQEKFDLFHMALLRARHEQHQDIALRETLIAIAKNLDLNMIRFQEDFHNRGLLTRLAEDHIFAVNSLGIFGTPTLVFPSKRAIYLKMSPPPPGESLSIFIELKNIAEVRPYIQEIKRPPQGNLKSNQSG